MTKVTFGFMASKLTHLNPTKTLRSRAGEQGEAFGCEYMFERDGPQVEYQKLMEIFPNTKLIILNFMFIKAHPLLEHQQPDCRRAAADLLDV